ncbi:MAG TPA: glycosyltransferase family 2 protein [Verrucomicrobiae bacterium]|jgi:glycosyltransferase involved in cell wall biosynthesis
MAAKSNADLSPCVSVVVPVFNEESTVGNLLASVLSQRPVLELIVVDDASNDKSWAVLTEMARKDSRVKLHRHAVNRGKGAALATALAHVSTPLVLIQDADLEYDPAEYFLLLKPILSGKADVVYGSRFLGSGAHRVLYFWHYVGNNFLTLLSNMLTNINLTDMETGSKAFRTEILANLCLEEPRFGFEPEFTAKISRLGLSIYEVPVSYYGRTYAEGKKIGWRDGLSALRCIIQYNLFSRRPRPTDRPPA